jgi:hypothetical protein
MHENTDFIQDGGHALAGRFSQLLIHDAETSSAWIAIRARSLPFHTLVAQFRDLTTNILGPAHTNQGSWGVQN